MMAVPGHVRRDAAIEVPRRMVVHFLKEAVRVEPRDVPVPAPLLVERTRAVVQHPVQAVHEVIHAPPPRRPVVRIREVDRGRVRARVERREVERNERVEDELTRAERVQPPQLVELAVGDVGQRNGRGLVVVHEIADPDVVRADEHDHDERVRVEQEPLVRGPVVRDVVEDEPVVLAVRHVGHAEERGERLGARRAADGVVPDLVIAVEAEVEGPLEAAICGRVCLDIKASSFESA